MGAWNIGVFDDDTAYDCLEEVIVSEPLDYFEKSFRYAVDANYLEYNECHRVTVSAAIIDMILNETHYEIAHNSWINWINAHRGLKLCPIIDLGVLALEKIISENSELNELWFENKTDYPKWRENIEMLILRLQNKKITNNI